LSRLCLDFVSIMSRLCLDCVSIVSRLCLDCVSIVSRLCLDFVSIVSRSCLNRESRSQHWQKVSLNSRENLETFKIFVSKVEISRQVLIDDLDRSRNLDLDRSQLSRPTGCHFLFSFYSIEKLFST